MHAGKAESASTDFFAAGDYSFWSAILESASRSVVAAARVVAGDHVLDVAAGNGNTALAASRRGAIVTALDPSQVQIEQGRKRAGKRADRSRGSVGTVDDCRSPTRPSTAASFRSAK